ncbi:unnamed protein product [Rodentolepis nana]|uniref:DUF295 domain-containing protein n=1 Tax=Rodentolepis nana TaxID=102285 RepID=A0A0R3U042_RODNA|nr:unnamed protein product [Rodentolepis nana]
MPQSKFSVFRFYFPPTRAYLSSNGTSSEVSVLEKNPFSKGIMWQWIPQPARKAILFRNLDSMKFLCFNVKGKLVALSELNLERCLVALEIADSRHDETFKIPGPVRIKSRTKLNQKAGFYRNGYAYAPDDSSNEMGTRNILPIRWDVITICGPIPRYCWIPECIFGNGEFNRNPGCLIECHLLIHCREMSPHFLLSPHDFVLSMT